MNKKWELLDAIMETELKYSEFVNLLMADEDIDKALGDPVAVIAPALSLGALMGQLMRTLGVTVEEYNKRAVELGRKQIKVLDEFLPPKKKEASWPIQ